jgi:hypothetical protein
LVVTKLDRLARSLPDARDNLTGAEDDAKYISFGSAWRSWRGKVRRERGMENPVSEITGSEFVEIVKAAIEND